MFTPELEIDSNAEDLNFTRYRLTKISKLGSVKNLINLTLRWNLFKNIPLLDGLSKLTTLNLYDNQVLRNDYGNKFTD